MKFDYEQAVRKFRSHYERGLITSEELDSLLQIAKTREVAPAYDTSSQDLPDRNKESWIEIIAFYEALLDSDYSDVAPLLLDLVSRFGATPRAERFRAGQSLWHLMISTAAQRGLKDHEPFVAVTINDDFQFQIEYWEGFGKQSDDIAICDATTVLVILDQFLSRLWSDTRGKHIAQ